MTSSDGIPVSVDWPRVIQRLHELGVSDDEICLRMVGMGVRPTVNSSTLRYLRLGYTRNPVYDTGAGILRVLSEEELKSEKRRGRRLHECVVRSAHQV